MPEQEVRQRQQAPIVPRAMASAPPMQGCRPEPRRSRAKARIVLAGPPRSRIKQAQAKTTPRTPASRLAASNPALELAHGELPQHQHAGFAIIEAGNRREVFTAMAHEQPGILDLDLLHGLQAVSGKTRRYDHKIFDALARQRSDRVDGIGLEPLRATEPGLE